MAYGGRRNSAADLLNKITSEPTAVLDAFRHLCGIDPKPITVEESTLNRLMDMGLAEIVRPVMIFARTGGKLIQTEPGDRPIMVLTNNGKKLARHMGAKL